MAAVTKTVSEECSAIAFYGIQPSAEAAEVFYHTVVQWFNELGCPPDKVCARGSGQTGRLLSFVRGNAKLQKTGFAGVTVLEIVSTISGAQVGELDYLLTTSYDGRGHRLKAVLVARSSIATLTPTSMLPVARILAQSLKPNYGIGYNREHRLGPDFYAGGICMGLGYTESEEEEKMNISFWSDAVADHIWRKGVLRDVYPWNFLTKPHLAKQIHGIPLKKWIRQSIGRGTVDVLCKGINLWKVPEVDIPSVRSALREAGALYHWRQYSGEDELRGKIHIPYRS